MDLTKGPESIVGVLTLTFDLEDLAQIGLLTDALHHVIEELGLGEGVLVIHGQVIKELFLSGGILVGVLEETEAAHNVVSSHVGLSVDGLVSVGQLLEESSW